MHPSGYEGTAPFRGPEPGSNGMTLDSKGRVTAAGHARRNVWRLESVDPKAQITVLADSYQGKKLNSPNDLVYRSDGSLYFTDPPYGLPTQGDDDPAKELRVNGVYRVPGALQQKPGAPPNNSHSIRYFGLLAPRTKRQHYAGVFLLLGQQRRPCPQRLKWRESVRKCFGFDPMIDSFGQEMHWL